MSENVKERAVLALESALAYQLTLNTSQANLLREQEAKISEHAAVLRLFEERELRRRDRLLRAYEDRASLRDALTTARAYAAELSRAHAEEILQLKTESAAARREYWLSEGAVCSKCGVVEP